jgi:hypothetical protein
VSQRITRVSSALRVGAGCLLLLLPLVVTLPLLLLLPPPVLRLLPKHPPKEVLHE